MIEHPHGTEAAFDAKWYVKEYPDVARSKIDPAEHYETFGKLLGRAPCAEAVSIDVRHVVAKKARFGTSDEVALLVTHAPAGRLRPHVLPYMKQLRSAGLSVMLVVVVDRPLEILDEEIDAANGIIVRDNAGYDFGAWAHGFKLCPSLFEARLVVMTNDSVIPTTDTAAFQAMMGRVRASNADISGLTANHEYGWHVQSYFLAFTRKALTSSALQDFFRNLRRIDDKDEVIRNYEIPFTTRMRAAGLTVDALYHGPYPNNPVVWSWRELVEGGFPFIKLLILRNITAVTYATNKEFFDELRESWPMVLEAAKFDIRLVHHAIRAADISWIPEGPSNGLLHDPDKFQKLSASSQALT